eukprot:CAMPEP_0115094790 /NCGR_PEP_ID=MMETSP0227-20121206/28603_1 /TAXON_ID=89957 /ORGANISM="Polarella glacialis, Strain CCMP 1383" /LENGTH=220 /DNA_ID=CAMNT_0002487931 /DNA_START=79 /DNA_END=738 /DNA_ORIENTATION=-
MYSLRKMNNLYEGGGRSDFIILGHPEFRLGIVGSDKGYPPGWDTTATPMHPKIGVAISRLKRAGSAQLLQRISVPLGTTPKVQDRVLAKKSLQEARGCGQSQSTPDLEGDFDAFLAALRDAVGTFAGASRRHRSLEDAPPKFGFEGRITSGGANHRKEAGIFQHRLNLSDGLVELADRLKSAPEATERDLLVTGSWRFWARELESVHRQQRVEASRHRLA